MARRVGRIRKQQPVTLTDRVVSAGMITAERARHAGGGLDERKTTDEAGNTVVRLFVSDSPIDSLAKCKHITQSMWEAGDRLRRHFLASGLEQLRAMDMTRDIVDGGQSKPEPEFREKHLQAYNRVVAAIRPWPFGVLKEVVLEDTPPEECGAVRCMYKSERDRQTAGMTELRNALRLLEDHFGIPSDG